jgi:hypothetical protein
VTVPKYLATLDGSIVMVFKVGLKRRKIFKKKFFKEKLEVFSLSASD